jgi:hypothetical protein
MEVGRWQMGETYPISYLLSPISHYTGASRGA